MLWYHRPISKPTIFFAAVFAAATIFLTVLSGIQQILPVQQNQEGIAMPVIMYHHILESSKLLGAYVITPQELEKDFQWIQQEGYTPVVVQDLLDYVYSDVPLPEKPIMITFDDGYESNYVYAYPLLQKYGYKAVISIYGRCTDEFSQTEDKHINYSHITWDEIREMADSGLVEFQNHTYNMHYNATGKRKGIQKMYNEDIAAYQALLREDLGKLQQEFQEHLGYTPTAFTYPFGFLEPDAEPVLEELGFLASFCCEERIHYITKDPQCLYKIRRFNRPHDLNTADFFEKMESTAKKRQA